MQTKKLCSCMVENPEQFRDIMRSRPPGSEHVESLFACVNPSVTVSQMTDGQLHKFSRYTVESGAMSLCCFASNTIIAAG